MSLVDNLFKPLVGHDLEVWEEAKTRSIRNDVGGISMRPYDMGRFAFAINQPKRTNPYSDKSTTSAAEKQRARQWDAGWEAELIRTRDAIIEASYRT